MRKLTEITEAVLSYHPTANVDLIHDAYIYSAKAHRGQSRRSGEAYLVHPVEVAYNLTRLKMDEKTVAAGLLHDTIEDTLATPDEIEELFGEEICSLVDGVTKIGQVEFASKEEKQAENYRKMILAMAKDIRVVMIKLADRAHNLRTLESLKEEQQQRIARETLDIYAALANRLGIGWLKAELEDGSFKYLMPDQYAAIVDRIKQGEDDRRALVDEVCATLEKELKSFDIDGTVVGRSKHFYSIYKKMVTQQIDLEDVYDLTGVRVITEEMKDCYAILGLVHSVWRPIPGKFKDYIAMPKPNMYQSLHTTVSGPRGQRVEVQIRTRDMHRNAEEGIAAHWQYKDGGGLSKNFDDHLSWVRRLLEDQKDIKNPRDFLNAFKVDLFFQEVFVFTPQGDVVAVPRGATPLDFAYQVHTDIGNHCLGAKVNGKMVPLRYNLKNGDRVEILTSQQRHPSRDWLTFVKTSKARSKISNYINSRERSRSLQLGREILETEFRKYDINASEFFKGKVLEEAAQACGYNSLDSLFAAVGFGKIPAHQVVEKALPRETVEAFKNKPAPVLTEKTPTKAGDFGIKVKNFGDHMMIRTGKCCNPLPGDAIVGYITRGRGISVHNTDCPSVEAFSRETDRMIEVEWDTAHKTPFQTPLSIVTDDKPGLLAKISSVLAACDVNITRANVQQGTHQRAYFDLNVEIFDLDHLNKTMRELQKTDGVIHVERVKEYKGKGTGRKTQTGRPDQKPDTHGGEKASAG